MDFAGAKFKFHSDSGALHQNFIVKNCQQIIIQNKWLANFCKSKAWLHDLMNNEITNDLTRRMDCSHFLLQLP
jgi:hypothetical protein